MIKLLQSKYHYKEEAEIICNKVQVKLSKECFHPSNTCITDLRTSHWEKQSRKPSGAANRKLAEECYFLWKSTRLAHDTGERVMYSLNFGGGHLLLLTNGERQTQREKIEACACQSYFWAIVVGGEQKEEPIVYLLLLWPLPGYSLGTVWWLVTRWKPIYRPQCRLKATVWINKNGMVPLKSSPPHHIISFLLC